MIGDNIKKIREMRNMSQRELAEAVFVKRQTISSWEVNRTEPNMGAIELLAAALNCRKSDLIGEKAQTVKSVLTKEESLLVRAFRMLSRPEQVVVLRSVGIEPKEKENSGSLTEAG